MYKIILDTDPGIDDAQAIAFAIAHPEIQLIGLTTTFGNADIEITTRNALTILERFGHASIPVAKGAHKPIIQPRFPSPDFVHGDDGIGNLNLAAPRASVSDESAADFIIRNANEQPGELSLVAIGPLTNLAQAVTQDPDLPNKLKELIVMGGTHKETGNVTPLAEANFINDPHAADIVLAHEWPAKVIGLDVTLQTLLRDTELKKIRNSCGSAGDFLWDSSRFYIDFYSNQLGTAERACAMHDASALVYLVAREAFTFLSGPARVISEGVAIGQLALGQKQSNYLLPHWEARPTTDVAIDVDADRVVGIFTDTLTSHSFS